MLSTGALGVTLPSLSPFPIPTCRNHLFTLSPAQLFLAYLVAFIQLYPTCHPACNKENERLAENSVGVISPLNPSTLKILERILYQQSDTRTGKII